jgi:hypothetical protein
MIISHQHRFISIKSGKTASTSVKTRRGIVGGFV